MFKLNGGELEVASRGGNAQNAVRPAGGNQCSLLLNLPALFCGSGTQGCHAMIKNSACDLAVFNRPRRNHGKGDQWNRMALEPDVLPCLPFIPADEQLGN